MAGSLLQRAIQSTSAPLQAVIAISSTPLVLQNELKSILSPDLPVYVIPSNVSNEVVPAVIDYLVQYAKVGNKLKGSDRQLLHVATLFDCTESDSNRIMRDFVFCRDIILSGLHFDTSCIFMSNNVIHLAHDLRANLHYVYAFAEPLVKQRKLLYKYYFGVFDKFEEFCDVFEQYVQSGDDAFVINNTVRSNNKWHMVSVCRVASESDLFNKQYIHTTTATHANKLKGEKNGDDSHSKTSPHAGSFLYTDADSVFLIGLHKVIKNNLAQSNSLGEDDFDNTDDIGSINDDDDSANTTATNVGESYTDIHTRQELQDDADSSAEFTPSSPASSTKS